MEILTIEPKIMTIFWKKNIPIIYHLNIMKLAVTQVNCSEFFIT